MQEVHPQHTGEAGIQVGNQGEAGREAKKRMSANRRAALQKEEKTPAGRDGLIPKHKITRSWNHPHVSQISPYSNHHTLIRIHSYEIHIRTDRFFLSKEARG